MSVGANDLLMASVVVGRVVDVVLPSHLHHEVGMAVLGAGKHLLMEKPMALSVAQCRDLVDTARAGGLRPQARPATRAEPAPVR